MLFHFLMWFSGTWFTKDILLVIDENWFIYRMDNVTPRVTLFSNYLHYKHNQASSTRVNPVVEVQNQNSKSGVLIWSLRFCLVWTNMLSQQIFRIYRSRIRPCSQERICSPWLVLHVCKTARIIEITKCLFQGYKQSKSTQFQTCTDFIQLVLND